MRHKKGRRQQVRPRIARKPFLPSTVLNEELSIQKLPPGKTAASLRQAAIIQAQQQGNALVQRMLAQRASKDSARKGDRFSALSPNISQYGMDPVEYILAKAKTDPMPLIQPLNQVNPGLGDLMMNSLRRVNAMRQFMHHLNSMSKTVLARALRASKG